MLKKIFYFMIMLITIGVPCYAYHIEVLQVSNIRPFDDTYHAFVDELAKNGIVQGKNLVINRHIIDADADASTWQKIKILFRIKGTASDIVKSKPDLVVTISTPATKYSKGKFIDAGIPVVFTDVAIPERVGCRSKTVSGPGFTGTTLYIDPLKIFKVAKQVLPNIKTVGMIYSDDDNAVAYATETRERLPQIGIKVLTKEVKKSDSIKPAAEELASKGIDAFVIPIDSYYGLRNNQPSRDLMAISKKTKIPTIACVAPSDVRGAVLYLGPDFDVMGRLTAHQVIKILKQGIKPEDIPVATQKDLNIRVDMDMVKYLGINIPLDILQLAKPIE